MLKSTRCFTHACWDLAADADWADALERAVTLVGSDMDVEVDRDVEWNEWWETSAR